VLVSVRLLEEFLFSVLLLVQSLEIIHERELRLA
jgi:hypothetical protein